MYSLKEERISTITPFSVLADNKRLRNKIIEGKSFQATRSGKNLTNYKEWVSLNSIGNIQKENNNIIFTTGNGSYGIKDIERTLKANTVYTAYCEYNFTGNTSSWGFRINKNGIWESVTNNNLIVFTTDNSGIITLAFYIGTPYTTEGDTLTLKNIRLYEGEYTLNTIPEYEQYGASPSPEFPSEIHSLGDDVNLLDYTSVENTSDTVVALIENGFNVKGKYAGKVVISNLQKNTDYYLQYITENIIGTQKNVVVFAGTSQTTKLKEFTNGIGGTFNTGENTEINIWFYASKGSSENEVNFTKIKLQKGTVATAYSEYGKGTVDIKQSGKNLLEITTKTTTTQGITFTVNTDKSITINGTNTGTGTLFFRIGANFILPAGTYTLSNRNEKATVNTFLFYDDGNSFSARKETETKTFKSEVTIKPYIRIGAGVTLNNETIFPMIEQSAVVTNYEPYKENSYIIPTTPLRSLPNGVKDTIEEDGIHRRVGVKVLNGSENWSLWSASFTNTERFYLNISGSNIKNSLCDRFTYNQENNDYEHYRHSAASGENIQFVIYINKSRLSEVSVSGLRAWLQQNPIQVNYELAQEVIEPFDEEQQAVINSMETFEGVNHFSLVGDLETTLTFDYNPQITEEIKKAFKYNITKAYLEVAATDKASGFQINEDNYLQSIDFDDCRYVEGEGVIGSCVAKELQGKFVNLDTSFDIENREVECFIGAETEDNITHYLRLGTFIVQKPENDNVKDNTSFDSLDYMIKFNKEYVHRMAKYFKTEDTDIYPDKQYYILNDSGVYEEVIVPHKEEISNYYEIIDEYTLMQLLKDICEQCEVKLGTFNFRNADYLVHGNRFDSGVSCRDVLKAIAQAAFSWARINEYNELLLDFETSDTISEEIDYNEYYGLNFNDNYGPVNTIVLKNSQAEGENITIKNDGLINSPIGKNLFTNLKWQEQTYAYFKIADGTHILSLKLKEGKTIPSDLYLGFSQNGYYLSTQLIKWIIQNGDYGTSLVDNEFRYIDNISKDGHILQYLSVFPVKYKDTLTEYFDIQLEKNSKFSGYEEPIPLGTKELAISDNPFAYSEETRKAIIQAGEAIYGFKYVPLSVETIGAAYLNCKDKLKIKNMQDGDLETYVFDTRISYQGTIKSNVETLAMTDTETKYRYDGRLTTAQRRTEFRVDKAEQKITSLVKATTEQGEKLTEAVQDLDGFKRTITDKTDETAEKVTTIEETVNGLVTNKSVSGGQNLIKNSVGYFGNDYWQINAETEGTVLSENSTDVKQNSISGSALKLQAETIYQDIKEIKNGEYYLSFNYKRMINTAIATLKVNDLVIDLTQENWTEETHLINVTTNNIKIEMTTDLNSSILITDLMLTEGNLQVSWTQNANESYTDNVQIGKGVKITATGSDTEFVAEASGITINNIETNTPVAEFTKYGTETQELVAHKDVKIADSLLIQKIGNQIWFSSF